MNIALYLAIIFIIVIFGLCYYKTRVKIPAGEFHVLVNRKNKKLKAMAGPKTYLYFPNKFALFVLPAKVIDCGTIEIEIKDKSGEKIKISFSTKVKITIPQKVVLFLPKPTKREIINFIRNQVRTFLFENEITEVKGKFC